MWVSMTALRWPRVPQLRRCWEARDLSVGGLLLDDPDPNVAEVVDVAAQAVDVAGAFDEALREPTAFLRFWDSVLTRTCGR
jgi:hypothetical protein